VLAAAEVVRMGYLVAIGIQPTYPETGYGYIRTGPLLFDQEGVTARVVEEFKEKPDLEIAERYVRNGSYLWNASMFVWRAAGRDH
jgi:mannose-1-phosphate guanylyltransferase